MLIRKCRLDIKSKDGSARVDEALANATVREVPVTYEVAIASERLALDNWDAADRFIAATARGLDATLLTADARLIACADIKAMANR